MACNEPFHSEPVNEIMGEVPSWTIRWGVTIIFVTLISIVAGACFIRYPQTVITTVLMSVSDTSLTGVIIVHSSDISKIKVGQEVVASLTAFPPSEYGTIKGKVSKISKRPQKLVDGSFAYIIEAAFNDGISQNLKVGLSEVQEVDGRVEILVQNKRLIDYLYLHLRF